MIVFTVEEPHLVPAKPSTHLTVFGFLRDDWTSQSSGTWDEQTGLQKLKEARRDPPLGHQRQSSPADPWGIRDRAALLTPCFKILTSRTVREQVSAVLAARLVIICCRSRKPDLISRNEKHIICHIF